MFDFCALSDLFFLYILISHWYPPEIGTAKQTQHGFVDKEPAMDGLDVRKVVQGKNPNDKY